MDWSGCELVEVVPGKVSGAPLLKGTRLPVEALVTNFEAGSPVEEIAENYPSASLEVIEQILNYARRQGRALQHDRAA